MDPATISLILAVLGQIPTWTSEAEALFVLLRGKQMDAEQLASVHALDVGARQRWADVLEADRKAAGVA